MILDFVRRLCVPLLVVSVVGFHAVSAWGHGDVFPSSVGGKVVIGGANELGTPEENYDLTTHVFEGVMIAGFPPINPADYGRDEPGFDALASGDVRLPAGASALPASSAVTVNLSSFSVGGLSDTLFYWNGAGVVDFQPISTAQPGVGMTLDPNPIGTTSLGGALHEHPGFMLDNGAAGVPSDGVYLIAPTVSVPGLATSDPFYMVWLVDALLVDEEVAEELEEALEMGQFVVHGKDFGFYEEAVEYVQNTLAVPEPSGGLLVAMGVTVACALSRKRRIR